MRAAAVFGLGILLSFALVVVGETLRVAAFSLTLPVEVAQLGLAW